MIGPKKYLDAIKQHKWDIDVVVYMDEELRYALEDLYESRDKRN